MPKKGHQLMKYCKTLNFGVWVNLVILDPVILAFLLPTTLKRYCIQIFAARYFCEIHEIKGTRKNGFYSKNRVIIIIIHEFHRDTSLEQNFRAVMCHVLHYSCNVNAAVADSLHCRMICGTVPFSVHAWMPPAMAATWSPAAAHSKSLPRQRGRRDRN